MHSRTSFHFLVIMISGCCLSFPALSDTSQMNLTKKFSPDWKLIKKSPNGEEVYFSKKFSRSARQAIPLGFGLIHLTMLYKHATPKPYTLAGGRTENAYATIMTLEIKCHIWEYDTSQFAIVTTPDIYAQDAIVHQINISDQSWSKGVVAQSPDSPRFMLAKQLCSEN